MRKSCALLSLALFSWIGGLGQDARAGVTIDVLFQDTTIASGIWISPGDPLVVPGKPTVVPDDGPPPVAEVPDEPGGLATVLEVIETAGINLEYMYAFTYRSDDKAILVFRFEDPEAAIGVLEGGGIKVLSDVELYLRVKE